jgi:hypothetical protein
VHPDLPVFRLSNRRAYTSSYRERASGITQSFRQTRTTDGQDINPDPLNSLASNLAGDDAIVATRESTDESSSPESVSDHGVGVVKGNTVRRNVSGTDQFASDGGENSQ